MPLPKLMLSTSLLRCTLCAALPPRVISSNTFSSSSSFVHYRTWPGLQTWRESPLNENRKWGSNGPESPAQLSVQEEEDPTVSASSLSELGTLVLSTSDPLSKAKLSHLAYTKWRRGNLPLGVSKPPDRPARPPKPHLVAPKEIPPPKKSGLPLNAYMLHNLAHVELNAIDLAWDTVVRFSAYSDVLGEQFFADFAHVADDESRHFNWCSQRLAELGFRYGDMPAHNLLWRECEKSSGDVAARLAVIPLVQIDSLLLPDLKQLKVGYNVSAQESALFADQICGNLLLPKEARGLDAGLRLVQKLIGFGDVRTSNIVARIADEEVAHVAVGVFWFLSVCSNLGRVPCSAFEDLLKEYDVELKGPFNYSARDEAGIPRHWYDKSYVNNQNKEEQLSEVYERLACIISMEKENSSLNGDQ